MVAPYAGAWIEMKALFHHWLPFAWSPPMRGRGLKYEIDILNRTDVPVAPYAGAWIEICTGRIIGL